MAFDIDIQASKQCDHPRSPQGDGVQVSEWWQRGHGGQQGVEQRGVDAGDGGVERGGTADKLTAWRRANESNLLPLHSVFRQGLTSLLFFPFAPRAVQPSIDGHEQVGDGALYRLRHGRRALRR